MEEDKTIKSKKADVGNKSAGLETDTDVKNLSEVDTAVLELPIQPSDYAKIYNLYIRKDKDNVLKFYYSSKEYEDIDFGRTFLANSSLEKLPDLAGKPKKKGLFGIYGKRVIGDGVFSFRVIIYDKEYIGAYEGTKHEKHFCQDCIRGYIDKNNKYHKRFAPIIHIIKGITRKDFDDGKCNEKRKWRQRFYRIMDSGIWNYFAADMADFNKAVDDIFSNWQKGYYNLSIAQEFAELNARLAKESYLYEQPDDESENSGHGVDVSPFLFHSESTIRKKLESDKKSKDNIFQYKWRFLLLDDKIDPAENIGVLQSTDRSSKITKTDIIKDRINSININNDDCCEIILAKETDYNLDNYNLNKNTKIAIVCVETVNEALELMKRYEFDVILLDYLLQKSYGYELLTEIQIRCKNSEGKDIGDNNDQIIIGPQEKLFFMFISAFTTAVNERLTLETLSRDEKYWCIGEGACPTNTPELFKYRLLHLMKRRLEQTGISELSIKNILETVKRIYDTSELEKKQKRIESVRKKAYETYRKILGFHYNYFILREKDKGLSALVDSFLEKQVHLGAMLEHLLQLVHLTALGTVRQWPEIWEEYQFVIRTINNDGDKECLKLIDSIMINIEEYIINLKSE